jgi:hypothetical protein
LLIAFLRLVSVDDRMLNHLVELCRLFQKLGNLKPFSLEAHQAPNVRLTAILKQLFRFNSFFLLAQSWLLILVRLAQLLLKHQFPIDFEVVLINASFKIALLSELLVAFQTLLDNEFFLNFVDSLVG